MKIDFEKEVFGSIEIDEKDILGIFEPKRVNNKGSIKSLTEKAVLNPIGSKPLSELLKGKQNVLIITDDNTRPTPLREIIEVLLSEIFKSGIKKENVSFLISLGTHRPMTDVEIGEKFGEDIPSTFRVINHTWDKVDTLVDLGTTSTGIEILVNREVMNADFIIAVGNIVPHATTGFSGGGKIIVPGIAGEETTEGTHWAALDYEMEEILGVNDNPIRRDIDEIAQKVGLGFIVNTILGVDGSPAGVVAGHLVQAHSAGVDISKEVYGAEVSEKADVVICDAFPTDIDLRQAIKGVASADVVVKKGGAIILVAECPEGIAPQFPEYLEIGFKDPEGVKAKVESGEITGKLMAYTLVAIGRVLKKAQVILVTKGISKEDVERLGFVYGADPQSALEMAYEIAGGRKTVFMKSAGEILPIIAH